MHLYECLLTHSTWYKNTVGGSKPIGILWHDTAAGNPNISRYVQPYEGDANYNEMMKLLGKNKYGNDWNHSDRDAGVHAFIGKLADGSIATVKTGDYDLYPFGCGKGDIGSCNGYLITNGKTKWQGKHWIQFETCDDGYKNKQYTGTKEYFDAVYKEAVEFTAMLCEQYGFDPKGKIKFGNATVPVITCHQEAHKAKMASNHGDVLKWLKKYGKTMDNVRNDVAALIAKHKKKDPKVSDVVKITGKTYYKGQNIPDWVLAKRWVVQSAKDDRIVINLSEDGKSSICSPVNINSLEVVDDPNPWIPKIGDKVKFRKTTQYSTSNSTQAKTCKSGEAMIIRTDIGAKHPYYLAYVAKKGSTVNGWVDYGTFTKL